MNEGAFERVLRLPAAQRNRLLGRVLGDDALRCQAELSYPQRRYWQLSVAGSCPGLNLTEAFRVTGPLDLAALDVAVARISLRHDQLRARFLDVDGAPVRLVSSAPLRLIVDSAPPAGNVRDIIEEEAERAFDLQNGPLFRLRAVVLGPEDHLLLINAHLLVADGPSLGLFFRELHGCYQEAVGGPSADLSELPISYPDYVAHQRQLSEGAALTNGVDFWRQALQGSPALLDLPVERPAVDNRAADNPGGSCRNVGALLDRPVPPGLVAAADEFARKESIAPFIVRLAAYALLLYRYTGQSDLLIGTYVAGRRPAEQALIGQFVNIVVVRADLSDNPTFRTLLRRVRRSAADAFTHAELPHEMLVEQLKVPRDPGRNPLYQVFYGEERQFGLAGLGGLHPRRIEVQPRSAAQLDLSMVVQTTEDGRTIARLGYDPMVFAQATVERLVDTYLLALAALVADPDVRADELDLATHGSSPWSPRTPSADVTARAGAQGAVRTYAVIGGGISGLTAAYRLRRALGPDARITLFDPADRLGGMLRTISLGGEPVDVGAEGFVARRPEVPTLLAELGLAQTQISTGARPQIYRGGGLCPLPLATVSGIPASAAAVAALVDEATLIRMEAEPARPLSWQPGADPAIADFVGDRFGAQVVARSVDPLLASIYAGSAATIGLRAAAPGVADALDRGAASLTEAARAALPAPVEGSVFGAIAGGYRILVDELVRQSRVDWTRSAVVSLQHEEGGWMLRDRTGASWRSDGVVIAVPAHRLPDLLATAAPGSAAAARRIPAASIAVMALAVPGDPRLPEQPGVLMASGEPLHAKAITLSSRKWGRRGELEHLRLSFGGFGDDVARIAGDDELLSWATDDVATVFGLRVSPVAVHVQRWIDATPQYLPGHAALVGELRAGLPESLAVAGNYLDGNGVADCIASGNAAAASLLRIDVARRASPALKTTKLNARPDLRRSMRS